MFTTKVLVALECAECSAPSLRVVASQFQPDSVELYLLHVIDPAAYPAPSEGAARDPAQIDALRQANLQRAHDLVDRAMRVFLDSGYRVQTAVREGELRLTIVAYARWVKADVILLSSHKSRGLGALTFDGVSDYVVSHAPCSVEVIRNWSHAA